MIGKFIFKFLIYNRIFYSSYSNFFQNLIWFKLSKMIFLNNKKHCLIQSNHKRSFIKKPKLNRFVFLKYHSLGLLPFKKK